MLPTTSDGVGRSPASCTRRAAAEKISRCEPPHSQRGDRGAMLLRQAASTERRLGTTTRREDTMTFNASTYANFVSAFSAAQERLFLQYIGPRHDFDIIIVGSGIG